MEPGAPISEGEALVAEAALDAYDRGDQRRAFSYANVWHRIYGSQRRRVPPSDEVVRHVIELHEGSRSREGRSTRRRPNRRQRRASRDGPDDPEPPWGWLPGDLDEDSAS